tara:strand:- start:24379 stop:24579 length:201 start_codon:yes stop_codon:yes gene_type:complete
MTRLLNGFVFIGISNDRNVMGGQLGKETCLGRKLASTVSSISTLWYNIIVRARHQACTRQADSVTG